MNTFLTLITGLLALTFCSFTSAGDLNPFQSDGCSSFPDGTLKQNQLWLSCCTEHDKTYWKGGTYQQRIDADEALRACVEKQGEPEIAELMLTGVRIGGTPYLPTTFRWAYGWPYLRGYKALTDDEMMEVESMQKIQASAHP